VLANRHRRDPSPTSVDRRDIFLHARHTSVTDRDALQGLPSLADSPHSRCLLARLAAFWDFVRVLIAAAERGAFVRFMLFPPIALGTTHDIMRLHNNTILMFSLYSRAFGRIIELFSTAGKMRADPSTQGLGTFIYLQ
jgi:hypothetical protein